MASLRLPWSGGSTSMSGLLADGDGRRFSPAPMAWMSGAGEWAAAPRRDRPVGAVRERLAFPGLMMIAVSVLLTITIGLLGPSPMVPALGGSGWQPPYSLAAGPDPYVVIVLAAAAVVIGGLGLLAALAAGPRPVPSPRLLVLLGCLAAGVLAFLPPSGSGDHLNYAAYGRMVTLGVNPYTHGADDLPGDPIADAVERPWREEPSVYGPVATALQALASWIGGDSLRLTIFVLAVFNVAAFVVTALLIDRFTRHDPVRRTRAALLWAVNPLLLYHLVAGMHADTLAIACMVAALLARAHPVRSGVLLGLGVATKLNAGLVALGPAWELRRRPGRLAVMAVSALAVVVVGYAIVGPEAIAPVTTTSKAISHASFWKLVQGWLWALVAPGSAYRGEIQVGALVVLALVAWPLLRLASRRASAGQGAGAAGGLQAPVVAAALVVAYLFATPYILPWYDGLAFGMLALVGASAVDRFMVAHLLVLSLAYLPARVDGQPPGVEWLSGVLRPQIAWALLALTVLLVVWAWRAGGPVRRPRASAAPPP
ncbi:polyprenol phosphomannose-dependent alpha 1,6 mannosyltransferase MptB [Nonomuraea sp. NPDC047529]|uniref:polyprenol phosphomannose-dependent alpha 1,6 mannosyltransferase MptB n=1 Tax=Nonomuraea sp. NPDC047529 TaxID=3155623 RepID=UPI0033D2512E